MKRITTVVVALTISVLAAMAGTDRLVGADISLVPAYEAAGDIWLDGDGNAINSNYADGMLGFLADYAGMNAMRVRLMVDPSIDSYLATCQDLDYVCALGKRIKAAGMSFLLDIFYSDTWTDVSQQWIPESWGLNRASTTATVAQKVKTYTTEVLNTLCAAGATPDYVQIGNEISYGFLWDSYSSQNKNTWFFNLSGSYDDKSDKIERFATILDYAAKGVRASDASDAKIVLHSERTISGSYSKNFYSWVETAGFTDYDVIGLSYYPAWHGSMNTLSTTLNTLTKAFPEKEIQIVETGYYCNSYPTLSDTEKSYCSWELTPAGQAAFMEDLVKTLSGFSAVTALYYWQPEECGNGADSTGARVMDGWDNRGLWELTYTSGTHTLTGGDVLLAMRAFADPDYVVPSTEETDMSGYFTNLDFEDCVWGTSYVEEVTGWTLDYSFVSSNSSSAFSLGAVALDGWESSLCEGTRLSLWIKGGNAASAADFIYQQSTAPLPAGTYKVSAVVHADGTSNFALFAGDSETAITNLGSGVWSSALNVSVTTTLAEDGYLTLGLRLTDSVSQSTECNLYADNFKVVAVSDSSDDDSSDDDSDGDDSDGDGIQQTISSHPYDAIAYTLTGQRVTGDAKGLLIVGGKKVLRK